MPERVLRVDFEDAAAFETEYAANLVNGGIFVASDERFELRERVRVDLSLAFCQEQIELWGEIVHQIPLEMAQTGATPGVAVQFDERVAGLRTRLRAAAGAAAESPPPGADEVGGTAPRMDARVAARIDACGETLEGYTRTLSGSGVLVSVKGQAVPVGEPVRLELEHPTTGERMQLSGRVVRAVETGGDVAALGIDFETPDDRRDEIERFIEHVQSAEHTRRLGGINGPIGELGVAGVIQMFGHTSQAGTIVFKQREHECVLGFEGGLVRYVQLGSATGMKAMVRMLSWEEGRFEFHTRFDPVDSYEAPIALEACLLEAARQFDESRLIDRSRFAPEAAPRVGGAEPNEPLDKLGEAVLDLVRAGFTVQRIVDVIPEPDLEIYRAFGELADAGVIAFDD